MSWIWPEGLYAVVMIGAFAAGAFCLNLPIAIAMSAAAVLGALLGGEGIPVRHLVEGAFGYIDTILIIASAMIFMKALQKTGLLESLAAFVIRKFRNSPLLLSFGLTGIVMIPGMITGSSTAAVLTAGALVAPVMMRLNVPADRAGALIAMAAIYGMIAPPVNIPAMLIGGGIDMPYVGFAGPLLACTLPLAAYSAVTLVYPYLRASGGGGDQLEQELRRMEKTQLSARLLLPVWVLVVLMAGEQFFPDVWPALGLPVDFVLAALSALASGSRFDPLEAATEAVRDSLPVMGILMGVGMFIQIMTLIGVQGFVVVSALALPSFLIYLAIATTIPLFGAISAFGAASILGVPFVLALLGKNTIVVTAAVSLIAGLGDLMPPTALAGIFAAQVIGEDNYFVVLRRCLVPGLVTAIWGVILILGANGVAAVLY